MADTVSIGGSITSGSDNVFSDNNQIVCEGDTFGISVPMFIYLPNPLYFPPDPNYPYDPDYILQPETIEDDITMTGNGTIGNSGKNIFVNGNAVASIGTPASATISESHTAQVPYGRIDAVQYYALDYSVKVEATGAVSSASGIQLLDGDNAVLLGDSVSITTVDGTLN
jgi:hypothetical protein